MSSRPDRWWLWQGAALLILLLAAGLRFYHLDSQSFWNDEGNSARLSERSVRLIIEGTASDIHPPLYYLLLRGWRELAGATEFGLRSFSAFLGVGLTALTLALGRRWFGAERDRPVPLLAALLVALNPTLIYYSQETRMYLLLPFLATLQTILLWRWQTAERPRTRLLLAYVLVAAAGLYTHYAYPLLLLAH
ncbi:MAG: glycosyltransferase family 39 protein, partial [Anaerolineales bacterium]|nr:glycosyltransferase family 39 protein [Anaerolineales bacterium]